MSAMASQIHATSIVYSTVCSGADQRKHDSSAGDQSIPRTKEQQRGKCFHLMTSSCVGYVELWLHYIPRNIHTVNMFGWGLVTTLRWRHNGRDSVSNQQPHDCLLNRLFRRRSKKTSKLRVTGLCVGNSPGTGEFPAQMASNAENISIWWRHHEICPCSSGFLLS